MSNETVCGAREQGGSGAEQGTQSAYQGDNRGGDKSTHLADADHDKFDNIMQLRS
jgi:hypothetical protein